MRGLAVWLTAALLAVGVTPAGAADKNAQYTEELLTILEETQSVDTFMTVLVLLKDQHVERHKFIPLVIRQAERLGIFAHHLGNKNLELTGQVEEFLHELATKKPTVKKRKKTPAAEAKSETTPTAVPAWVTERMEEKYDHKNDCSTPVMSPIREGSPATCEQPPDDGMVLRALPRASCGVSCIYEESREDVQVVTELLVDKVDAPRFFPLIGPAQLHHCHWKCTVYYTEMIEAKYPFAFRVKRPRVQVIYIDKDHLHLHPGTEKTSAEPKHSEESAKSDAAECASPAGYVIEPPDILNIQAVRLVSRRPTVDSSPEKQIVGEHLVRPDGTISLGTYGSVYVAGMTRTQSQAAVEKHLSKYLLNPEIAVTLAAYNSKVFYVITAGDAAGEYVHRFACTGKETVLDTIRSPGLQCEGKTIWLARPQPGAADQVLRVNWEAICRGSDMETNYQMLPGDRLYIMSGTMLGTATVPDLIKAAKRGGGAFFIP